MPNATGYGGLRGRCIGVASLILVHKDQIDILSIDPAPELNPTPCHAMNRPLTVEVWYLSRTEGATGDHRDQRRSFAMADESPARQSHARRWILPN